MKLKESFPKFGTEVLEANEKKKNNNYGVLVGRCNTRVKSSLLFSVCGTSRISKRLKTEIT